MNVDLNSLKSILHKIREKEYPNVPENLIDSILTSASEHLDDESASIAAIRTLVDDYIKSAQ